MTTTSLKLPRRAPVAQGWCDAQYVEAIRQAAAAAEQRAKFIAAAKASHRTTLKQGTGFDADEVHDYIRARAAGAAGRRPKATPWRG